MGDDRALLERMGYLPWDNHPNNAIHHLNNQLKKHGLEIVTFERKEMPLWFKIQKITKKKQHDS